MDSKTFLENIQIILKKIQVLDNLEKNTDYLDCYEFVKNKSLSTSEGPFKLFKDLLFFITQNKKFTNEIFTFLSIETVKKWVKDIRGEMPKESGLFPENVYFPQNDSLQYCQFQSVYPKFFLLGTKRQFQGAKN